MKTNTKILADALYQHGQGQFGSILIGAEDWHEPGGRKSINTAVRLVIFDLHSPHGLEICYAQTFPPQTSMDEMFDEVVARGLPLVRDDKKEAEDRHARYAAQAAKDAEVERLIAEANEVF